MVYYCVHGATILTGEKFKVSFDIQPPPLPHTPEAQRSPPVLHLACAGQRRALDGGVLALHCVYSGLTTHV